MCIRICTCVYFIQTEIKQTSDRHQRQTLETDIRQTSETEIRDRDQRQTSDRHQRQTSETDIRDRHQTDIRDRHQRQTSETDIRDRHQTDIRDRHQRQTSDRHQTDVKGVMNALSDTYIYVYIHVCTDAPSRLHRLEKRQKQTQFLVCMHAHTKAHFELYQSKEIMGNAS
jgi:hypothetical protein